MLCVCVLMCMLLCFVVDFLTLTLYVLCVNVYECVNSGVIDVEGVVAV